MSTPRLELTAAVVSVKIACLIRKELNLGNIAERFWTDSQVVLAYIRSTTKRFKVFVANRVQKIQEHSDVNQWNYVKGKTILLMMHQEDLIQERRLQAVDCSLDLYSYGKEKNFRQVTVE